MLVVRSAAGEQTRRHLVGRGVGNEFLSFVVQATGETSPIGQGVL